jgi:hypothetical protein
MLDVGVTSLSQQEGLTETDYKRSFFNWFPQGEVSYRFSPGKTIKSSYSGKTVQPNIQQLQPITNNTDPLNIVVGNPDLATQFSHLVELHYMDFKAARQRMITMDLNFQKLTNPISNAITTDISGRNIYQFENFTGQNITSYRGDISYGRPLRFLPMTFGTNGSVTGQSLVTRVNSRLNHMKSQSYNIDLIFGHRSPEKYNLSLILSPGYVVNKTTLNPEADNNYWQYRVAMETELYLPSHFELHSELNYQWQGKTEVFNENFHQTIWNIWIEKKILKKQEIFLRVTCNDLLNQNKGFTRNIRDNVVYQNTYNTIARYFLVSLIFDFNQTFTK